MERLRYKLDVFEGPLDLLLQLIEKNKIDIYDIPIAEITEQYLDYVNRLKEEDLDIVSDFLVMAATLLEIKSRMLLPRELDEEGEEIDPRAELVERLLEYKKYKYISRILREKEEDADRVFYGSGAMPEEVLRCTPPLDLTELLKGLSLEKLREALEDLSRRQEEAVDRVRSKFGVIRRERVSLSGRIRDVLSYARRHGRFSFRHMIRKKEDRMDIVVSFLAVLELMKMGKITLMQDAPFSDMDIQVVGGEEGEGEPDLTEVEEFDG